jgi:hypothetical protein
MLERLDARKLRMLRMHSADLTTHHKPGVLQRGTSVPQTHLCTFCCGGTVVLGMTGVLVRRTSRELRAAKTDG